MPSADDLICAALRGEPVPWPWHDDPQAGTRLLARAAQHGVGALLHDRKPAPGWPAEVLQALRQQAVQQAMWEMRHQRVIAQALAALVDAGAHPVLLKGTALAYSLYPNPVLRTRGDTDMLVAEPALPAADGALRALGFVRAVGVSGEFVSYQASYTLDTPQGGSHTIDLHWKINNSQLLSTLFSHDELLRDAQPLPALGPQALAPSPAQALLVACMHRSTHKQNPYYVDGAPQYEGDRLIWLYDLHLLASCLSADEWNQFTRLAAQKGLRAVCLDGIAATSARYHTSFPAAVLSALGSGGPVEPVAVYLDGSKLRQQWMDFLALRGWADRLRFIRELFFPSADYMRHKYSQPGHHWLPWLYLRRAAGGLLKGLVGNRSAP